MQLRIFLKLNIKKKYFLILLTGVANFVQACEVFKILEENSMLWCGTNLGAHPSVVTRSVVRPSKY